MYRGAVFGGTFLGVIEAEAFVSVAAIIEGWFLGAMRMTDSPT